MILWRRRDQIKHKLYGNKTESFQKISTLLKFLGDLLDSNGNKNSETWIKLKLERILYQF